MKNKYTDAFKIAVVRDYYTNELGVRQTASKWGLPSKNYITNWETYLKGKNLLPDVPKKSPLKTMKFRNATVQSSDSRAEIQALTRQNEELRAALDFERAVNYKLGLKKKRNTK